MHRSPLIRIPSHTVSSFAAAFFAIGFDDFRLPMIYYKKDLKIQFEQNKGLTVVCDTDLLQLVFLN